MWRIAPPPKHPLGVKVVQDWRVGFPAPLIREMRKMEVFGLHPLKEEGQVVGERKGSGVGTLSKGDIGWGRGVWVLIWPKMFGGPIREFLAGPYF